MSNFALNSTGKERTPLDVLKNRKENAERELNNYNTWQESMHARIKDKKKSQARKSRMVVALKLLIFVLCILFLLKEYFINGVILSTENRNVVYWIASCTLILMIFLLCLVLFLQNHIRTALFLMYHFICGVVSVLAISKIIFSAQYSYIPLLVTLIVQFICDYIPVWRRYIGRNYKTVLCWGLATLCVIIFTGVGVFDITLGKLDRVTAPSSARATYYEVDKDIGEAKIDHVFLTGYDVYLFQDEKRNIYIVEDGLERYTGLYLATQIYPITTIGSASFSGVYSVSEVHFSPYVTKIERGAFCDSLVTRIVVKSSELTIEDGFDNTRITELRFSVGAKTTLHFESANLKNGLKLIVDAAEYDWYVQNNPEYSSYFVIEQ